MLKMVETIGNPIAMMIERVGGVEGLISEQTIRSGTADEDGDVVFIGHSVSIYLALSTLAMMLSAEDAVILFDTEGKSGAYDKTDLICYALEYALNLRGVKPTHSPSEKIYLDSSCIKDYVGCADLLHKLRSGEAALYIVRDSIHRKVYLSNLLTSVKEMFLADKEYEMGHQPRKK